MSWQIPTLIEQDIKSGKAQYRTFQTGNGGQSILPVPSNSYVVIFGYDFSPAGGGYTLRSRTTSFNDANIAYPQSDFATQQVSFYTGTDFYPFIHHVDMQQDYMPGSRTVDGAIVDYYIFTSVNPSIIARQVYITSTNDVTITHGLIANSIRVSNNTIPVTNRTPIGLTYGGSAQSINTQTNYGPLVGPLQFMQPSPKDYQDFGFGLLPNNADGQAFATPDAVNGLRDATNFVASTSGLNNLAAVAYYLCLHYALYTETVPESRG
ncbi:MAG: hypothetical protein HQL20_11130 [Candidatus Omnitrophica bacterium]|nr:hypothetical protein [Candidatus Omnitrophota bacterium]